MSYQVNNPKAKCDQCGRVLPWSRASVTFLTPDSEFSKEDYEVLCPSRVTPKEPPRGKEKA